MSAFTGLLAIRRYSAKDPSILLQEVIEALKHVYPDDGYHDYDAALILHDLIAGTSPPQDNIPVFFRDVLTTLIRETKPWWTRFFPLGRERVRAALSLNESQCLDAAGLFSQTPSAEILQWWDTLAQEVRETEDSKLLAQGRAAEKLTIEYETQRLSGLGIPNRPRWVSLDDNAAGYDVHSYDKGPVEPVAKLIEVKSCARRPPEIFLTRNEWETAIERAPHYWFHVWILPEETLIELAPSELSKHIPENQGRGLWQAVRIAVPLP